MAVSPDFTGFRDAQVRLRDNFGHDLSFYTPVAASYASGVALDPESGDPYDPTLSPTSGGGFTATTVRVSVVARPMGLSKHGIDDDARKTAIGWLERGALVLVVEPEDWPLVSAATEVEYANERYAIRQTDHDYLGPVDRYLIYAEQM